VGENVREFCLNADLHGTFRDLLHAVKLRDRTDIFTSPPKEGLSLRKSTQRRKVELWAKNVLEFCLNADLHVTFRGLLHAVKL
jgi:hypothetical protein